MISVYGKSIIIDAAHAYYFRPPEGIVSINSARKFFGVPDGAHLYGYKQKEKLEVTNSYNLCNHLLKRFDVGAKSSYKDYLNAESHFDNLEIGQMSNLTRGLLSLVDFDKVADQRRNNFNHLHEALKDLNSMPVDLYILDGNVPMVYPFRVDDDKLRSLLIDNSIYVATYWPNVFDWCDSSDLEFNLAKDVIPLPIDQRYGIEDMDTIILCIKQYYEKK